MASGLLIKQKQLLAGDGIAINHGETASTISIAENAFDNSVRIYDATVEAETGVITITDGTPVADLAIGDEIRTPDGVYQKVKDSITTTGPADGTRIEVSGITSPSDANGYYVLQSEDVWKHETANYWITHFFSSGWYWMISNKSDPANPGEALFYRLFGSEDLKPWEADSSWDVMNDASGNPSLQNVESSTTITNTIDLFEYASMSVKPADIVQSVNGNKPDASGNVTIETGGSVDESRLLPESPDNGDIPMFNATSTVGGGNDTTVKLLIQPSTSDNQIVDSANGNAAPVTISQGNDGSLVTVDEAGNLAFPGNGSYITAVKAAMSSVITGTSEFCIDITLSPEWESGTRKILHLGADGWYAYLNPANGAFWFFTAGSSSLNMGLNYGEVHRLTLEQWNSDGTWKLSMFTDGSVKATFDVQVGAMSTDMRFGIGDNDEGGGYLGTMNNIRVRNFAPYHGVSFTPDAVPYTVPQVVGAWQNQSLDEQIDAKISTHNADTSAHPDKLPLSGGQMTGELKINATNALRINNGDYGVFLRKDASAFYIMVTAQGDPNGGYTEARPLKLDLATGECYINGGALKDSNGNVIVTTYAPLNHPAFSNGIEILGTTPYIDFHYNNSESDYTFRIVQNSEDTLTLDGKVSISNNLTVTSGGMSVAGNIKNTGEIQSETTNSYRLVYGNYGTFWRNDGNSLYLMLTNSGDQYGSYNSLRPLTVDLDTGDCSISGNAVGTESKLSSAGVYPRVSMNTTTTADFDTFKTQGNYWFALGIRPNGPLGDTTSTTGVLSVYNIQNTHTLQVYNMYSATGASTQQMYYRWCYGGTWTSWNRIATNAAGMPNYSAGAYITNAITQADGSYTCPSAGWILIKNLAPAIHIYINGEDLSPIGEGSMIPVSANDVVTISGYMQDYSISVLFYPNR